MQKFARSSVNNNLASQLGRLVFGRSFIFACLVFLTVFLVYLFVSHLSNSSLSKQQQQQDSSLLVNDVHFTLTKDGKKKSLVPNDDEDKTPVDPRLPKRQQVDFQKHEMIERMDDLEYDARVSKHEFLKSDKIDIEYFAKGIILSNKLEPFYVNEELEQQVSIRSNPNRLKEYFFTPELRQKIKSSSLTDRRKKEIYKIGELNGDRYRVTSDVPGFKVHVKFNQLAYRDDFVHYPFVKPRTKKAYCEDDNLCQTEHGNNMCSICDIGKDKIQSKFFYKSWCYKPNIDFAIVSIEDGILDYGTDHPEVRHSIFDKSGNLYSMPVWHPIKLQEEHKWSVAYNPQIAVVGNVWFPSAVGHFPIEILPRIILLSTYLPYNIPILVYGGEYVEKTIKLLTDAGVFPKERVFIYAEPNIYYTAKRLYFLHSNEDVYTPLTTDIALRVASSALQQPLKRNLISNPIRKDTKRDYILVVDRSDSNMRRINNNDQMVKQISELVKDSMDVVSVKLSKLSSFLEIGKVFYDAKAIIAPHGAGLANLSFAKRSTKFVIEIGWPGRPKDFHWPGDYYCQSRGSGLKYYAVTAVEGHYSSSSGMKVDVDEIVSIVKDEFKL
ncbi:hypothetical protein FDP41_000461 [Naegleria fowleri]|uniref:Glycosyltransferase 61 catalytic domain-containing protein n=1 Tax=Naegleria fowleri TaxID=5763 RepID=A0A6A5CBY0_NAEFO|nr:uncharacterized protein FDP41_000461 [Naegleria fowleri]KAF0984562.1 hypothetical protein FDP41_000461 [Naegleria fowleri]